MREYVFGDNFINVSVINLVLQNVFWTSVRLLVRFICLSVNSSPLQSWAIGLRFVVCFFVACKRTQQIISVQDDVELVK